MPSIRANCFSSPHRLLETPLTCTRQPASERVPAAAPSAYCCHRAGAGARVCTHVAGDCIDVVTFAVVVVAVAVVVVVVVVVAAAAAAAVVVVIIVVASVVVVILCQSSNRRRRPSPRPPGHTTGNIPRWNRNQ